MRLKAKRLLRIRFVAKLLKVGHSLHAVSQIESLRKQLAQQEAQLEQAHAVIRRYNAQFGSLPTIATNAYD